MSRSPHTLGATMQPGWLHRLEIDVSCWNTEEPGIRCTYLNSQHKHFYAIVITAERKSVTGEESHCHSRDNISSGPGQCLAESSLHDVTHSHSFPAFQLNLSCNELDLEILSEAWLLCAARLCIYLLLCSLWHHGICVCVP